MTFVRKSRWCLFTQDPDSVGTKVIAGMYADLMSAWIKFFKLYFLLDLIYHQLLHRIHIFCLKYIVSLQ